MLQCGSLRAAAGKLPDAVFLPQHVKAHRFSHPGQHGDFSCGAFGNAQGRFLPGNDAPAAPQVHLQIQILVTQHRPAVQRRAGLLRKFQLSGGMPGPAGRPTPAFG